MPTYDYVCDACEHKFELFQSIKDDPIRKCPECKKLKLRRLFGSDFRLQEARENPAANSFAKCYRLTCCARFGAPSSSYWWRKRCPKNGRCKSPDIDPPHASHTDIGIRRAAPGRAEI